MTTTLHEIIREHAGFVWRTLQRHGVHEADLPDQCQEVFLVVHRKLPEFRGDSTLRTWLYGIALHVARAHRRRAHVVRESIVPEPPERAADAMQERTLEGRRGLARLQALLAAVEPEKREVFLLFEVEELPMAEVARLVGRPLRTTYAWYQSVRKHVTDTWQGEVEQ
jgi:RNA polymerase sigma-70 factor (ECF subfamily)